MELCLNIIILVFEILYYSLFMKYGKKEGSLLKYIVIFFLATILVTIFSYMNFMSYIIFVLFIILSMKYLLRIKTSFYDLFFIFIMMIFKIFIETLFWIILQLFVKDPYIMSTILSILKVIIILVINNRLHKYYLYIEENWNKNRFFIRYIFTVLMYGYIIMSCVFLILNR